MNKQISFKQIEILQFCFKKEDIEQILKENSKNPLTYLKIIKKLKKLKKQPIPNDIIKLFYDEPKIFFEKHKTILNNTSYFDECDNSIFAHYFNILYLIFTKNKISNSQIYLTNFNSFFLFHGKYLSIQDLALETPLHKIVKLRNKCFFLIYYDKLKEIGVVNEQILLIKNINNESCFDFIFKEMVINRTKLINKHFDIYIKFLKNNYVYISTLPIKAKLKIKFLILKYI